MKATTTSRQIVKYFLADLRPLRSRKAEEAVVDRVRIIKYEAVPKCGSYEVRFSDGRPSKHFYWEDIPAVVSVRNRPTASALGDRAATGMFIEVKIFRWSPVAVANLKAFFVSDQAHGHERSRCCP